MKKLLLTTSAIVATANVAMAQQIIDEINIKGNKRLQPELIETYLPYSSGRTYTVGMEQQIIKKLFATGLFSDVRVSWDKSTGQMTVEVNENPQVNRVAFEDNEEIADSVLEKIITLKSRAVFTNTKVQEDINAIQKAYRTKGYYLVEVSPEYIKRDQNRIDVIYKITEGPETLISKINFIGNKAFSDSDLEQVVSTKENKWWRLLSSNDAYDPDRVDFDKELLRRYYMQRGYADFSMNDPIVELQRDKSGFIVTYTVNEGVKYSFGNIDVSVADPMLDINIDKIKSLINIEKNQTYNTLEVEKNIDRMVEELSNQGYAFVEIIPMIRKNQTTKQINLTFDLKPGPRIYVNRINIEGNTRTQDNVIRRQLRLAEGDALQQNKLKRSKDRLSYLDYFSKVDITSEDTNYPDKVDLNVKVEEQSTGEFNIGAGVSSYEGVLATLDIKENNFLGKGQQLNFGFSLSSKRKDFNLGITEPWFMGRELLAGADIYSKETSYDDESSYDEKILGTSFRLGFPLDEFKRNTVRLRLENKEVTDVDSDASRFIKELEGDRTKVAVANTLSLDTRDNKLIPTKGYNAAWTVEYAGFGADISYVKNVVRGSYNYAITDDYVLTVAGRTGYLWDINDDVPITENFRGGGSTLRGFASSGIGPRDSETNDALGGQFMIGHNVELRYPIPGMKDSGVNGLLFWDGGLVTDVNDPYGVVDDEKTYRQSVGTGVFWRSPLGPLRFEFGIPIVSADGDEKEVFSFSFGTRF